MNKINSQQEETEYPEHLEFVLNWLGVKIFVKWEENCFGGEISHFEIRSENACTIPLTETGFRSHFLHKQEVFAAG
jgi:hypothetical protein